MKTDKRFISLVLSAVLFAVAVSFGGGCGGSSDSPEENRTVQVIGELHGKYAEEFKAQSEIETVTDLSEASKDENQPIIVSKEQGLSLSEEEAGLLKERLMAGQAVCIEHVWGYEIDSFLEKLGVKMKGNYTSDLIYQYYGIKNIDGNFFAFLAVEPEQPHYPDLPDIPENGLPDISEEDAKGSGRFAPFTMRGAEEREEILSDVPAPLKNELESEEYAQKKSRMEIADTALDWMFSDEQAKMCSERAENRREKEVTAQLAKEERLRGVGAGTYNLADMDKIYHMDYKLDFSNQAEDSPGYLPGFNKLPLETQKRIINGNLRTEITVDITTCHVYNEATEKESDWFFIKQSCDFDASYFKKEYDNLSCKDYASVYNIKNYPLGNNSDKVLLKESSPENKTDGSKTTSSEMSHSFGPNLGILTGDLSSLGGEIGYSHSEEFTVEDVTVTHMKGDAYNPAEISWDYRFADPSDNGVCFAFNSGLKDPVKLSRGTFSPVNQWAWEVPDEARDDVSSFYMELNFTWRTRWPRNFVWWIQIDDYRNWDYLKCWHQTVPLCDYAPIITVSKVDILSADKTTIFPKAKCFRDWEASSDSDWCHIYKKGQNIPLPGDSAAEEKYGKYIEGTKDELEDDCLYVEIAKNNGPSRTAVITYKTKDGKGECRQIITQRGAEDYTPGIVCEEERINVKSVPTDTIPLKFNCFKEWTASSDRDWCLIIDRTVDGDEGSQFVSGTADTKDNFEILVLKNTTGTYRTAKITLKTADDKGEDTLIISQGINLSLK